MPLRAVCPSCRNELVLDEAFAGRDVDCPRCGQRFTGPSFMSGVPSFGASEPAPRQRDLDDLPNYDRAPPERPTPIIADLSQRWRTTVVGLNLMFWTTVVILLLVIPLAIMGGISDQLGKKAAGQQPAPEQLAVGLSMVGVMCLMLLLGITGFVGMCLCCAVPSEAGAKGRAIAAVVTAVVTLLFLVFTAFAATIRAIRMAQEAPGQPPIPPDTLVGVMLLFVVLGLIFSTFWMLFHRAIALHFGDARLARSAMGYLICNYAFALINGLLSISDVGGAGNGGLAGLVSLVTNIILLVWFLRILRRTRTTIVEGVAAVPWPEEQDDWPPARPERV